MRLNLKKKLLLLLTGLFLGLSSLSLSACYPAHTSLLLDYSYPRPYPDYYYYDHYYGPFYYYPRYYYGGYYSGPYYYPRFRGYPYGVPVPGRPSGRMIR